jgi:hypothetical protein
LFNNAMRGVLATRMLRLSARPPPFDQNMLAIRRRSASLAILTGDSK